MSRRQGASPVRVGIIGCGRIANSHVQAVAASAEAELAALIDPVQERSAALISKYGLRAASYPSVADALPHIDAAVIATPNHLHADVAVECISAGIPVLIEKPLAASLADGLRITEAASATGVVVAVGYVTRFTESNQLMRDLLRRDAFGRIRRFAYQFGTRGGWAPLSAYNLDRNAAGGGVLVVTGTHFLDRMLDWFGYPVRAELRDDSEGGPEANAVATFTFDHPAGPVEGSARFSKTVALEAGIVLDTDAGTVLLRDKPGAEVVIRSQATPNIETTVRGRTAGRRTARAGEFVLQLQDFIAAIQTGAQPMVSGQSALASLRLLEELYQHRQRLYEDHYAQQVVAEGVAR